MDQPLYIAPDEEIISVIARLRSLPDSAVTLVFPKHSVVTQSIINLKLLAREGEKLQKKLTLVSQNENARSLAEKIGFNTLPYTQEMEKGNVVISSQPKQVTEEPVPPITIQPDIPEVPESSVKLPKSSDIGSQNFYSAPPQSSDVKRMGDIKPQNESLPSNAPESGITTLRVRNMSPERPPSLNSLRVTEEATPNSDLSRQSTVSAPIFPDNQVSSESVSPVTPNFSTPRPDTPTAIRDFFNRGNSEEAAPVRMPVEKKKVEKTPLFVKKNDIPPKKPPVIVGKNTTSKLKWAFFSFIFIFTIALAALFFFLIFPKASVMVMPQTISDSYDQSFTTDTTTSSGEVPLQKVTTEITAEVAGIASGAAGSTSSSGSRAKGTIKISNNYGSDAQTLVATTRFESASGKIYRIQENVSVPGNGSVEATVIADGSGESYNLNEGTLTIPGFKGTDKFEKFSATVVGGITGGGGTEEASGGSFIRADEETLRSRAAEEAKRIFTGSINNEEGDTYTFTDGLVLERVSESTLPKVGSVPGEYTYSGTFKITAFTTSREAVTKNMLKNIRSEYDGITFAPITQELSFADFTVAEGGNQASVKAHLEATLAASIDEVKIKKDLAGKTASDLEGFTTTHPEIKALDISFHPSWALKRIPTNPNKIDISINTES